MHLGLLMLGVFVLAATLTGLMRRYALSVKLLDLPNERSSHQVPTPSGGGVAIVAAFMAGLGAAVDVADYRLPWAIPIAVLGVAVVGYVDDRRHIPAGWRLLSHFVLAGLALWSIGIPKLDWLGHSVDLGLLGGILAILYLVWMLNLYNFMDGIDGIAGVEALTAGVGAVAVWLVLGNGTIGDEISVGLVAAAAAGFLVWNFPPAKIFMGDAGSGFLGLIFGILSLRAALLEPSMFWCWLVLLGTFIVDATITLLRRLLRKEKAFRAHRDHAYQHASRELGAHRPVTLAVGAINLVWLLPWALAIASGTIDGPVALAVAYLPLVALALRFRAGLP